MEVKNKTHTQMMEPKRKINGKITYILKIEKKPDTRNLSQEFTLYYSIDKTNRRINEASRQ